MTMRKNRGGKSSGWILPKCQTMLVGRCYQTHFKGWEEEEDAVWSDPIRVFPNPPKTFSSARIPRAVTESLTEADRSLQAGAHIAACVMFGRALEAICRDVLEPADKDQKRRVMLGAGIRLLKERKLIDERLYDWSQQLQAFRNLAAHPEEISISREDADDLQAFVHAITEYIYDLADRYEQFKVRAQRRASRRKPA